MVTKVVVVVWLYVCLSECVCMYVCVNDVCVPSRTVCV